MADTLPFELTPVVAPPPNMSTITYTYINEDLVSSLIITAPVPVPCRLVSLNRRERERYIHTYLHTFIHIHTYIHRDRYIAPSLALSLEKVLYIYLYSISATSG
jgi:hypothetical protein